MYQLIHAVIKVDDNEIETWINCSENFRREDEEKIPFDMYYDLEKIGKESPLDFAVRKGWSDYFYKMILVDYLVANRDRHGSNIEVLRNIVSGETRLAPLFDQGESLLFLSYGSEEQISKFDVLQDIQANNFVGSRSLAYNLSLIPSDYVMPIRKLQENDKAIIFNDMDRVLSEQRIEKLREMIWKRWNHYEILRNKK